MWYWNTHGHRMAALVSDKSSIAVITIPGQRNLDDRVAGVADALKNFPAIKLTKILDDKGDDSFGQAPSACAAHALPPSGSDCCGVSRESE